MGTRALEAISLLDLEKLEVEPFFCIDFELNVGPMYLWNGYSTRTFNGKEYTGAGGLITVSQVKETSDTEAVGASITLVGLPTEFAATALKPDYKGTVCTIYFGLLGILDESPVEIFSGFIDQMDINKSPDGVVLEVSVENRLIDLERVRVKRFTSEYQKSIFPGDKGLDFIEDLQDKEVFWGRSVS